MQYMAYMSDNQKNEQAKTEADRDFKIIEKMVGEFKQRLEIYNIKRTY